MRPPPMTCEPESRAWASPTEADHGASLELRTHFSDIRPGRSGQPPREIYWVRNDAQFHHIEQNTNPRCGCSALRATTAPPAQWAFYCGHNPKSARNKSHNAFKFRLHFFGRVYYHTTSPARIFHRTSTHATTVSKGRHSFSDRQMYSGGVGAKRRTPGSRLPSYSASPSTRPCCRQRRSSQPRPELLPPLYTLHSACSARRRRR